MIETEEGVGCEAGEECSGAWTLEVIARKGLCGLEGVQAEVGHEQWMMREADELAEAVCCEVWPLIDEWFDEIAP